MFDGLYPKEDDPLEEEESMDDIANYEEVDENLPSEVSNFSDEELGDVDFLMVDDILSDSHNINCYEFYVDGKNYMFTIGIVLTPTGKMDFGPACAAAGPPCVAAPASASAPVARMVLRSTVSMRVLLVCFCYSTAYLAPSVTRGKQFRIEHARRIFVAVQ